MSTERPEHTTAETSAADAAQPADGTLAADDDAALDRRRRRELLAGGDAKRAPHSLSETERHPIEGASSGTSWDDPDEL